ncbi:MAG: 4Fe-4S binding protein [Planctomycetes bacterium]|nr:4Fe-4S binding protein [Planctomycetota bacterium]
MSSVTDPRAALPRLDRHRPKGPPVRPSRSGRRRAFVLIGVHVLIGLHFLHWGLTGSSVTPVEPSESMQTVELGRLNAGFLLFVALIASTLVFGRWFCGWGCHIVALQDLSAWLLRRVGLKPRPLRSRLLVLAPFAVAYAMFLHPIVLHWWDPVGKPLPAPSEWQLKLVTDDLWVTFPGWIMAPITLLVVGGLIVWWLGAKGFCTHGCPYGAFFALADRVAPLRIVVSDACEHCGHCTSVCSSNVRVHEEVAKYGHVVDPGCMKCLDCVSVCPKDALSYGPARPQPFAVSQQRIAARADFSWGEEIAVALLAFVATQFTFRGAWFGEGVPLLLAVGLGVITAVFALLGWRLLRRPDVEFQHTVLKRGRRFTSAGFAALGLVLLWLAFSAHTFAAQRLRESAIDGVRQLRGGASPAQLEQALAGTDRALSWDLVDDPRVQEMRGLVLRGLGRHADAERALLGALAARDRLDYVEANLALAAYAMDPQRARWQQARALLEAVLANDPQNEIALRLHERLGERGR